MTDIRKWKQLVENALTENPVKDTDYTDHEVSMARSQLLSSVKSAVRIAKHLSEKSEADGIEGWVASKITVAEDYLQAVADYMDGEDLQEGYKILPPMDKEKYQARSGLEGPFSTLSGKVVYYDPKAGKYYDPDTDMYISYEDFQKLDNDYSDMKEDFSDQVKDFGMFSKGGNAQVQNTIQYILRDFDDAAEKATNSERDSLRMDAFRKLSNELEALSDEDGYEEAMDTEVRQRAIKYLDQGIIRIMNMLDKKPIGDGDTESLEESEALTEEQFDEAAGEKDACYRKVKSRYKVWPSAYASGALVKCRKVGAKNWGNSKK